jgi:hypothetical protein
VAYLRNRYEKVQRGKVLRGETLGAADEEIVSLWKLHCAPLLCCDGAWP